MVGGGRQPFGQCGSVAAHQMVIADVDTVERSSHRGQHSRVPVAQVEDAAVAVAVEPASSVEGVVEGWARPLTHHRIEGELLEEGDFSCVDERYGRRGLKVEDT